MKLQLVDYSGLPDDVPAAVAVRGAHIWVLLNPRADPEAALDYAEALLIRWQLQQQMPLLSPQP